MSSLLTVAPSTIVARLAAGDLKAATPAEINTLLGAVVGPASSTDNAIARFDLATGKLIQDSPNATLDDNTHLALAGSDATLDLLERASQPTAVAGRGYFWVKSDTPSIPQFTDDAGTDQPLITNEANVTAALNGATPGAVTPELADSAFIQDNSDSDNLKLALLSDILALAGAAQSLTFNGNFNIWQRGTTFTGAANVYTADRWAMRVTGAGVVDVLRSTDVPNNKSDYSLHVDVTTADATLATTDFYGIEYRVEGYDALPLAFGAAGAESVTISFWVKSAKTGIHSVALQNSAINRSYVAEYSVSVADTWEFKTITIAGDTTGTWLTDNGIGLAVIFALASGPDRDTTAGSWQAGDFKASTNQVNVMDNAANNFRLSQVQVEVGTSANAFSVRPFSEEYRLCKRYYQKTFPLGVTPATGTGQEGTLSYRALFSLAVSYQYQIELDTEMRIDPGSGTVTFYNPVNANANWHNYSKALDSAAAVGLSTASNAKRVYLANAQVAGDAQHDFMAIHFTLDTEL